MRKLFAAVLIFGFSPAFAAEEAKGGMPQLDPASYASQLFWLAVFFVAFYAFMSLVAMPRVHRIIDARQTRIDDDLGHASEASGTANALKHQLDARLAGARDEARKLLADAVQVMSETAARREGELAQELHSKIESAETEIAVAKDKALTQVSEIAAVIVATALPRLAPVSASTAEIDGALNQARSDQMRAA